VTAALSGHGLVSKGPVWERHWAFPADWTTFPFNPQLAMKTISGKSLRFTCLVPADAVYERLALAVKQQLAPIGVDMVVEEASIDRLLKAVEDGTFEAVLMDGNSGPTLLRPYEYWHSGGSFNPGGLGNPTVDGALDRLRQASTDDDYRRAVSGILKAFMDDPPAIFLAWSERARAVSKRYIVPPAEPGRDILSTLRLWKPAPDARLKASRN
jgi:ABC-type transport system substrate-binding protein